MVEAVQRELRTVTGSHKWFWSHGVPIPECFNKLACVFLGSKCRYAWFVEEDVIPPAGSLQAMIDLSADISFVNYRARNGTSCFGRVLKEILWVGTGCTLIHRDVFQSMDEPYFKTQYVLATRHRGSATTKLEIELVEMPRLYGGHDIYFCFNAWKRGFGINVVLGMECEHVFHTFQQTA